MKKHMVIEAQNSFESGDIRDTFGRAASFARGGDRVTLILVRDGVEAAVRGAHSFWFAELARLGVEVVVDLGSLRARGIDVDQLSRWVRPAVVTLGLNDVVVNESSNWSDGDATWRAAS